MCIDVCVSHARPCFSFTVGFSRFSFGAVRRHEGGTASYTSHIPSLSLLLTTTRRAIESIGDKKHTDIHLSLSGFSDEC